MRGFTLIELIIILGILALTSVLAIPFIQSFQVSSDLLTHTQNLTQTLRRARQQAIFGQNNSNWGVYFDNSGKSFILFKGENFTSRDQDYDQKIDYPAIFNVNPDFGNEIYFSLYTGQPSVNGTVTISSPNNASKDIIINNSGLIEINN